MSSKVFLHVDRLVLRGVGAGDRDAVVRALRESLSRSLGEPGMAARLAGLGHLATLRVPALKVAPDTKPRALGRATAEGIARSLRR